jgi:hypothetical protein
MLVVAGALACTPALSVTVRLTTTVPTWVALRVADAPSVGPLKLALPLTIAHWYWTIERPPDATDADPSRATLEPTVALVADAWITGVGAALTVTTMSADACAPTPSVTVRRTLTLPAALVDKVAVAVSAPDRLAIDAPLTIVHWKIPIGPPDALRAADPSSVTDAPAVTFAADALSGTVGTLGRRIERTAAPASSMPAPQVLVVQ